MYRLDYAIDVLIFEIDGEADHYVRTHVQDHHRYPCCIPLLLAIHDFHLFLISFAVKFFVLIKFVTACYFF